MKTRKNTKRALILSALSLLLCVSMLVGTTFAWFTDTDTATVSNIVSGTLDIEIVDKDGNEKTTPLTFVNKDGISEIKWEPGATFRTEGFQLKNKGSLWLKYKIQINNTEVSYNKLNEVIDFSLVKEDGTEISLAEMTDIELKPDTATTGLMYLQGTMDKNAGNDYQNLTMTGVSITVLAAQAAKEFDSTTDQYDKDAGYGILAKSDAELAKLIQEAKNGDTIYLTEGTFSAFNMEGKNISLIGATDENGNPVTKILNSARPVNNDAPGVWEWCDTVNVENIIFEAASGAEGDGGAFQSCLNLYRLSDSATFTNCKFVNQGIQTNASVTFTKCSFEGNSSGYKGIMLYPADSKTHEIVIDGCTFSGYNCTINVQEAGSCSVTAKNSTFAGGDIEVGALKALTFENCTLNCNVIAWFKNTTVTIPEGSFGSGYSYTNHNI